jgi:RNA polymerase sigma-70 factor (ECF subfamily)
MDEQAETNSAAFSFVFMADRMREPETSTPAPQVSPDVPGTSVEDLVCAFNEVRTQLVSTLFFVLGNYEDAQDAAQEAFVKCWRNRDGLESVQSLRAWIFRVGLNAAKDLQRNAWRRRARPLPTTIALKASTADSPVQALEERETQERLRRALLDLRPAEKEVFLLRQNGGLTYEEIARLRQCPVGTIKTQMRMAVLKLRQVLQEKQST